MHKNPAANCRQILLRQASRRTGQEGLIDRGIIPWVVARIGRNRPRRIRSDRRRRRRLARPQQRLGRHDGEPSIFESNRGRRNAWGQTSPRPGVGPSGPLQPCKCDGRSL